MVGPCGGGHGHQWPPLTGHARHEAAMPDVCRLCEASTSKTTCFGTGPGPGALSGPGPQKSQNGKIFMRFSQSRHINRISVLGHFKAFGCQGPVLGPNPTILQRPSRVAWPPNGPARVGARNCCACTIHQKPPVCGSVQGHAVGPEIRVVCEAFIQIHLFGDGKI